MSKTKSQRQLVQDYPEVVVATIKAVLELYDGFSKKITLWQLPHLHKNSIDSYCVEKKAQLQKDLCKNVNTKLAGLVGIEGDDLNSVNIIDAEDLDGQVLFNAGNKLADFKQYIDSRIREFSNYETLDHLIKLLYEYQCDCFSGLIGDITRLKKKNQTEENQDEISAKLKIAHEMRSELAGLIKNRAELYDGLCECGVGENVADDMCEYTFSIIDVYKADCRRLYNMDPDHPDVNGLHGRKRRFPESFGDSRFRFGGEEGDDAMPSSPEERFVARTPGIPDWLRNDGLNSDGNPLSDVESVDSNLSLVDSDDDGYSSTASF